MNGFAKILSEAGIRPGHLNTEHQACSVPLANKLAKGGKPSKDLGAYMRVAKLLAERTGRTPWEILEVVCPDYKEGRVKSVRSKAVKN